MCGFAGVLRPDPERPTHEELSSLAQGLRHRGPDDEGFHLDGGLGLAHRRLSILDLSPAGHQPLANEDGSVRVAYNGQLFGFQGLRERLLARGHVFRSRTDTEVLVHLYEDRGLDMLDEVDGMFAFALWDARRRRLLLARDRLGIKPLYYAWDGRRLAFASELPPLLTLPGVGSSLDLTGLVQYLYQSSVPGGASALAGVAKLPPAHALVLEDGALRTFRYWSLPAEVGLPGDPFQAAARELDERLSAAVASHLVADVPVGAFLSGGLDSTAVCLHARAALGGPLHTFSVRFRLPGYDEGPAAREVAEELGTIHHELDLGPECVEGVPALLRGADEPFAVSSALALQSLARFARETVKVVLTGDGADEILAGYPWRHEPETGEGSSGGSLLRGLGLTAVRSWRGARGGGPGLVGEMASRLTRLFHHPDQRYAEIVSAFSPEEMEALLAPGLKPLALGAWEANPVRRAYAAARGDEVNRRLRADLGTTLVDEMLTKVDRATMAAGLEARVPFLDRALVEWAFRQPGRYKVREGSGKLLLRRALARRLPRAASRPKHGFDVPLGAWLRGPLRPLLQDALAPGRVRQRGLLDPRAVDRLLRAHLEGRGNHARKLYNLLALELWLDELPRRRAPAAAPGALAHA